MDLYLRKGSNFFEFLTSDAGITVPTKEVGIEVTVEGLKLLPSRNQLGVGFFPQLEAQEDGRCRCSADPSATSTRLPVTESRFGSLALVPSRGDCTVWSHM